MLLRPVDASGDVLPVLSVSALLSGPEAVAQLVRYRLSLLTGEWWENPSLGFPVLEQLAICYRIITNSSRLLFLLLSFLWKYIPAAYALFPPAYSLASSQALSQF